MDDMNLNKTSSWINVYLIRHGESETNTRPSIMGGRCSDAPLSQAGRAQCYRMQKRMSDICFDKLVSSTATRAIETAKFLKGHIHPRSPCKRILQYRDLEELSHGDAEGKLRSKVYTPEVMARIKADPLNFKQPNGESQADVRNRATKRLNKLIANIKPSEVFLFYNLGIVCHGYVIKSLVADIFQIDPSKTFFISTDNCSVTKLTYSEDGEWKLCYLNRLSDF